MIKKEVGPDDIAIALLADPVELDFYPNCTLKMTSLVNYAVLLDAE